MLKIGRETIIVKKCTAFFAGVCIFHLALVDKEGASKTDGIFKYFIALQSVKRRFWTTWSLPLSGFRESWIVKCSVRMVCNCLNCSDSIKVFVHDDIRNVSSERDNWLTNSHTCPFFRSCNYIFFYLRSRRGLSQFWDFTIRRTTFLNYSKFVDPRILRLQNWEKARRVIFL